MLSLILVLMSAFSILSRGKHKGKKKILGKLCWEIISKKIFVFFFCFSFFDKFKFVPPLCSYGLICPINCIRGGEGKSRLYKFLVWKLKNT